MTRYIDRMLTLTIDTGSPTPPFEQLRLQILERVQSGDLAAEARLPPVRALATQLGLAANTVARAYRQLEADGVIETRGRHGSFISAHGDITQQEAQQAARLYANRIRQLGISAEEGLSLVKAALLS
ncbi:MAG: GntR family transcriptional regulator [Homoserinimonas sp.]|jgi:DNA-binding transcriptional regulator YhcF (GntR family)|nr:GntR family transcriptional regulator [Homoserinimonas sp.]